MIVEQVKSLHEVYELIYFMVLYPYLSSST